MRENTPLTNTTSLDQDNSQAAPESVKSPRFSFIERLLSNAKTKKITQKFSLQPIKHTQFDSKQQQQLSAKSILKKAIIFDSQSKFNDEKKSNFLMKGKMLSGLKKPIQIQMASLLLGINERIKNELAKEQKNQEEVRLSEQRKDQKVIGLKNFDCATIFKNLKELKLRRMNQQSHVTKIQHVQKRVIMLANDTLGNQSQNWNKEQAKPTKAAVTTISHSLCPPLGKNSQNSFKKGYIAYNQDIKIFLEKNRISMGKHYIKITQKTKQITANAFLVLDCSSLTPIVGRNINLLIQIASISKVMTCYLCLMICKKYNIDIYSHQIRISQKAAQTPGTTAQLQSGDVLTIYSLLMALMLPSGNDASVTLAQGMGKIIQRYKKKDTKKNYFQTFVAHMNLFSKQLDLNQTWGNSSGLSVNPNFSTPQAIALLTAIAVKDQIFSKIVNTKVYEAQINNQKYGLNRKVIWRNTNKLLDSGWQGVKTGTTENAGHCLMAKKGNILVCVFNCETLSRRFSQCVRLYQRFNPSLDS